MRSVFGAGLGRGWRGPRRRSRLLPRSLMAGPSWATGPQVKLGARARGARGARGGTQPWVARLACGAEWEAAAGQCPGPRPRDGPSLAAVCAEERPGTLPGHRGVL